MFEISRARGARATATSGGVYTTTGERTWLANQFSRVVQADSLCLLYDPRHKTWNGLDQHEPIS